MNIAVVNCVVNNIYIMIFVNLLYRLSMINVVNHKVLALSQIIPPEM